MIEYCQNLECNFPNGSCARRIAPTECPDAPTSGVVEADSQYTPFEQGAEGIPWSGDALSLSTIALTYGLRRPHIVALVGLPDAGKTSFLTTLYHRIRHEPLGGRAFAGSFTLRGWEVLHQNLKWRQSMPPAYPPRTSGARREPGLLHLSLRGPDEDLPTDVLLADTPGEWFQTFSRDTNVPGAHTTLDLADGFLLTLNPVSLSDARRHAMRQRLMGLIRRVKESVPDKPVVLVLSHADQPAPRTPQYEEVLSLIQSLYPGHATYSTVSAFEARSTPAAGQGVLEATAHLVAQLEDVPLCPLRLPDREALLARLILESE